MNSKKQKAGRVSIRKDNFAALKKWLAILLLMITAAGTFIPCCQTDDCSADQISHSDDPPKPEGSCSPFFSCATCTGFVEITNPVQLPGKVEDAALIHPERPMILHLSHYQDFLLQPPRTT